MTGKFLLTFPLLSPASNESDGTFRTGLGLLNQGNTTATLSFHALDDAGKKITGAAITNPATRTLRPQAQLPLLEQQLLGNGWMDVTTDGWLRVGSDSADVSGLFMIFDEQQSFIESAPAVAAPLREFIFADIQPAGENLVSLINTDATTAVVNIDLVRANGKVRASARRLITGGGMLLADLYADLFPAAQPEVSDYVRVSSEPGVRPLAFLRQDANAAEPSTSDSAVFDGPGRGDIAILTGLDAAAASGAGAPALLAPRYVHSDSTRSTISVVNLDPLAGGVTLRLTGNDGVLLGGERRVEIPANGKLYIDDPSFFMPQNYSEYAISGYVEIVADAGVRITGNVMIEDSGEGDSYTALPLVREVAPLLTFNHVAFNDEYAGMMALVNPLAAGSTVTASLHAADGHVLQSTQVVVPAHARIVRALDEYFPLLAERGMTEGYIRLTSDRPVTAYMDLTAGGALAVIAPRPGAGAQTFVPDHGSDSGENNNGDNPDRNDPKTPKEEVRDYIREAIHSPADAMGKSFLKNLLRR